MLVVCFPLLSTSGVSAAPLLGQIDFQVIHPPHGPLAGQPAYFTIRSKEQWLEWWNAKVTGRLPTPTPEQPAQSIPAPPPPPGIDFERSILVVASSGAKLGTGNSIAFIAIFRTPSGVVASVQETAQRGSCVLSARAYRYHYMGGCRRHIRARWMPAAGRRKIASRRQVPGIT
jgi:hypothetical protein